MSRKFLTAPRLPGLAALPSAGEGGRILYKSGTLTIHFDNGISWDNVLLSATSARIHVGTSAPSSPATGDIWIDTN